MRAPDEKVQANPGRDWLQLLIVPLALAVLGLIWGVTQWTIDNKREDRSIAADRATANEARQDTTLQTYLDQMSGLMLHEKLLTSKKSDAVRAVARTVTLTALRRLDEERRAEVIQFLFEANLVDRSNPAINLFHANVEGAVLEDAFLQEADLSFADLSDAVLKRAFLKDADLTFADLRGARVENASLKNAVLLQADLTGANLKGANLMGANLAFADLSFAHLEGAKNLDLNRYISELPRNDLKPFLGSEKDFLDSLSREELARFNLSRHKLAMFRERAGA